MPIYEYKCRKCQRQFEYLAFTANDPDPECPNCHSSDVGKLMSAGFVRAHGIPTGSGGFTPPQRACGTGGG